ncbi:hypothetical protein DFH08DRAFT_859369 [Mycena albidolilacea]|uniref:VTT domain-containing protein n=1 Tax=Mycena albidolilacea TaxID=1033008 RepID=A0AAD7AAA8_9AGAR|nr:hypothetical protein DFH08DRAFT_859369 [Mycena albidolilacea]
MRPSRSPRPAPLSLSFAHQNASEYTLQSVDTDHTPLNTPTTPSYGSTIHRPSSRRLIFNATLKMACVFLASTIILGSILWLALPTLEEDDRPKLRIPKSFAQLQDLNGILKKYRDIFPYRIFICFVVTYLFLQAFSLPGSMYMSILGGAVWGMPIALPLVCCLVASGATLCYLISDALGPALLTIPKWKAMLDKWARKIQQNQDNMISFLIVLRIAPLPPHWALNILAPHVGISIPIFWISTALGILGVSVIHTTIGGGLEQMTSSDDFHLISWRNFFGLSAVVVGVMIPVGLRYWFGKRGTVVNVEDEEEEEEGVETTAIPGEEDGEEEDLVLAVGPPVHELPKDSDDDESEDDLDDQDIVLEAGPAIALVPKDNQRA